MRFTKTTAKRLYKEADAAGKAAADACTPAVMIVGSPTHPLGSNIDPSKGPVYRVSSGVCGFASVQMPGNTSLARRWKDAGLATTDSYNGGVRVHVFYGDQSFEKKTAYAAAFAGVLKDAGVAKVWVWSRMD